MGDGDGNNNFGSKYTYAVVVRGSLSDINQLVEFLEQSNLVIAHTELGTVKMWIQKEIGNEK